MSIIIPAVLPTSAEDLREKLLRLQGISQQVQIDLVDGIFAAPASWPFSANLVVSEAGHELDSLEFLGSLHLEIDLMVSEPDACIRPWVAAGANRITIHTESTRLLPKLLEDMYTTYGHDALFTPGLLSIGLALHASTDTTVLEPFISHIDYVQFMGIDTVGRQGAPFDARVLPKIRAFKKKYPQMPVQIDGGVTLANAPTLLAAGASRLVVGSALWKARHLETAYKEFVDLTTRYGTYT